MAISDHKIKESDYTGRDVVSAPDRLTGTPRENKLVFDRLTKQIIIPALNALIDELTNSGASSVGTSVSGVAGTDVQTVLESMKALIDDRYTKEQADGLLGDKADKTTIAPMLADMTIDDNGVITITRKNGTTKSWDTALEKIAVNFDFDAETQKLKLTLEDGTTKEVDLSAFVKPNEFVDSATIDFTAGSDGTVTATIRVGSVTDEMLDSAIKEALIAYRDAAAASAAAAKASENNAMTYKQAAETARTGAEKAQTEAEVSEINAAVYAEGGTLAGHEGEIILQEELPGAKGYMLMAQQYANNAATSASAADTRANSAAYSEESALSSKKAAKSYMDSALSHRNAAEEASNSAVQAATDAASFASAAEKSKNSASNYARETYEVRDEVRTKYNGVLTAADRAENAAIHQPYPDANTGTWWVWDMDAGEYRDSGIRAKADELKIAGPNVLGGVQPVTQTDDMTIPVGVDEAGGLHAGKDPDVDQLKSDINHLFHGVHTKECTDTLTAEDLTYGYVNGGTGVIYSQKDRLVTKDFIPDTVARLECASPYKIRISAWERESGNFVGNWDGSVWTNTNAGHQSFDLFFPEYRYKICIVCPASANDEAAIASAAASVTVYSNQVGGAREDMVNALLRKTVSGKSIIISDAIAGSPMHCTCDSPVTLSGINIMPVRDVSFTGVEKEVKLGTILPAGTYTFSVECESNDTDSDQALVQIGGLYVRFTHDGKRYSKKITTKTDTDSVKFYSSYDALQSAGDTVFWRNMMIVDGDRQSEFEEYFEPVTFPRPEDVVLTGQTNLLSADSQINITYIQKNPYVNSILSANRSVELDWETLGYVTPEMFGAVGDGVTDDTAALEACLNKAQERGIPAKMMKSYLISEGIAITSNMSVEINSLTYTGTQAAVEIVGQSSSVNIRSIKSIGTGVKFRSDTIMVNYNRLILGEVVCGAYCIYIHSTNKNIHTNHIEFQKLYAGGDGYSCIFMVSDSREVGAAEITFIGGLCTHADWAYCGSGGNSKFYNFQVENDIKGGYLFKNACKVIIIGDRHDESQRDGEYPYIKLVVPEIGRSDEQVVNQLRFITPLGLNVNEIDVSEVSPIAEGIYLRNNGSLGVIDCRIVSYCETGSDNPNRSQMFGERALIWGNCLIFQGAPEKYWKVTESMDLRTITANTPAMPSVFDIACADSEIHLHPTYCFMGIPKFEVIQTTEYTTKIYDYYTDSLIFDGASLGEGTFEVKNYLNGDYARLNGEGMIWRVRKIS